MALRSLRLLSPFGLFVAVGAASWIAACGSSDGSKFGDGSKDPNGDAGFNSSSGFLPNGGDGGDGTNGEGGPGVNDTLRIEPATITVTATGTLSSLSGSQAFKAYLESGPDPVDAVWSVDDAGIGKIDSAGLFKTATFAGKTKVRARVGNLVALAEVTVLLKIEETNGTVTDDQKTKLKAGGSADTAKFKWLYPYDKTVFPRGLLPPKLMFGGATPTAYFVRLSTKNVDYSGYYQASGPQPRVIVSNEWWNMVTRSAGANDPVKIQVTKIEGDKVTGPIEQTWSIAQGSLKGTVFYNTYNSTLVKAAKAEGAIMRLKPGSPVEVFIGRKQVTTTQQNGTTSETTSTCTVCHSVSANGTALVTGLNWGDSNNPYDSAIFSISTTGEATARASTYEGRRMPFGGLTPDGNWLVGNASAYLRGLSGDYYSRLYNAQTGAVVDDSYFGTGALGTDGGGNKHKAIAPAFSPDTTKLAFGDREADKDGHRLSVLDVSLTAGSPPSFSNNAQLAKNPQKVLGWPTFLPDSHGVIYGEGTSYDTGGFSDKAQLHHYCGELSWVDTTTKLTSALNRLNGYNDDGKTSYLPFFDVPDPDTANNEPNPCNTQDLHMNYEPTVLPVAVGGYYWVVFTSRRAYGNFIWHGAGSVTPGGDLPFDNTQDGGGAIKGYRKKLWVAAIDINGAAGTDISHPAFMLEGQETEAGNMRGFWALDPCKADGAGCEGGDECCNGFCRAVDDGAGGTKNACVAPPSGCANDSERCKVAADCCNAADGTTCVNGFCAAPTPGGVR
ncbi:MAG: hypothetical protein U0270_37770 [Labilithrix sp.]